MKYLLLATLFFSTPIYARDPAAIIHPEGGLQTDRPSRTESPYTLVPGRLQLEADIISYSYDRDGDSSSSSTVLANNTLRIGATENTELHIIVPSVVKETVRADGETTEKKGFGDVTIRYKVNIFGNHEDNAFGATPYVKLPTAGAELSNQRVEGGLILPFSFKLNSDWGFGGMVQLEHLRRADDTGWETGYILSGGIGRTLFADFAFFVELYGRTSDNSNQKDIASADLGFMYQVNDSIQLDTGIFYGLTDASDDYITFVGISINF